MPYRLLATYVVIGIVLAMCREVLRCRFDDMDGIIAFCSGIELVPHVGSHSCFHFNILNWHSGRSITSTPIYTSYYARLLMLSADIESNPGPLSENEQIILDAIKASENRVLSELQEVKGDIKTMKSEIRYVKNECIKTKEEVEIVKQKQFGYEKQLKSVQKNINHIQSENETMQLDIDQLHDNFGEHLSLMTDLEDKIDRLERESRKSTMRIFGLTETAGETSSDAKQVVIDNVLKVACSEEEWCLDDLQRAFRAGNADSSQPRMMIVTFRYSDDKFRIYSGREKLRERGIRVSDDLTQRQRQQLKELKQKGYTGYFYKGQIHTRQQTSKPGPNRAVYKINNDSMEHGPKRRRLNSENASKPLNSDSLNQPVFIHDAAANGMNDQPNDVSFDSIHSQNSNS